MTLANGALDLCLIGPLYEDTIIQLNELNLGETNKFVSHETRKGGMYNVSRANLDGIGTTCFPIGKKKALILSEQNKSRRTSIVKDTDTSLDTLNGALPTIFDWVHIMYLDDLNYDLQVENAEVPVSVDFCTLSGRDKYVDIINSCEIVFDSRERKDLYANIITATPIILHDELGCECIISGKARYESQTAFVEGLHVNGAGDIFSAIFIREYNSEGIERAVAVTPTLTTAFILRNQK